MSVKCEKHKVYHGPVVSCPHCVIDNLRSQIELFREALHEINNGVIVGGWNEHDCSAAAHIALNNIPPREKKG